ncbi:MAG: ABC transporter substrate-binding protein, partial [Nitrospirae bacterium]|nr:ABC transporter substrate-binding protein [Nitrospirota bacterium]
MKKVSIVIFLLFSFLFVFTTFTTAGDKSILDVVKEKGVVRIGSGNATPPMNYIDEKGNWVGFDVDI